MPSPADPITNANKNLCEYGGAFGVLLSLVCLVQHFAVVIPSWFTNPMIPVYILSIVAFLLLALQKIASLALLIICAVLAAAVQYIWMTHHSFSLVVLLLFIYQVIIIIALFNEGIPKKFKQKKNAMKAEEDFWAGKL